MRDGGGQPHSKRRNSQYSGPGQSAGGQARDGGPNARVHRRLHVEPVRDGLAHVRGFRAARRYSFRLATKQRDPASFRGLLSNREKIKAYFC
jgi:hypothetical protein